MELSGGQPANLNIWAQVRLTQIAAMLFAPSKSSRQLLNLVVFELISFLRAADVLRSTSRSLFATSQSHDLLSMLSLHGPSSKSSDEL